MSVCEWCGKEFEPEFAESEFSIETGLSYENLLKCLCDECSVQVIEDEVDGMYFETCEAVSYTHLTLPTTERV